MRQFRPIFIRAAGLVITCLAAAGCQGIYYGTMEMFGKEKRHLLVDRVEDARDSQEEAKEQFQSALERFTAVTGFKGGKLEDQYNKLKSAFEASEARAKEVSSRIKKIESVAEDLFEEWEKELKQMSNADLRASSQKMLVDTRQRYTQMLRVMHKAEARMQPVIKAFRDQVLFLKHNLNAKAINALQGQFAAVQTDVADLIKQMEASISEADSFIKTMGEG